MKKPLYHYNDAVNWAINNAAEVNRKEEKICIVIITAAAVEPVYLRLFSAF